MTYLSIVAVLAVTSAGSTPLLAAAATDEADATATDEADATATLAPVSLDDRIEAAIAVPGSPDWPTAAFGSIWVLAPDLPLRDDTETPNLVRIDPATNQVVASIALPDRLCQGFVATDDAIWVCAVDALVRVDPSTDSIVSSVPIKGSMSYYRMAYGGGMVWALGSGAFVGDTVIRLDPSAETTTSHPVGGSVGGMVYAFDALWLTVPGAGSVVRLDPATGETREWVTGLPAPTQIAAGQEDLWVSLYGSDEEQAGPEDPQLVRIDPISGEVVAELMIGGSPRGGVDIWAGEEGLIVRSTRPWLARFDEASNSLVETIVSEPDIHAIQGPLTVAFGSIWTVNIEEDVVYRLTP
jgi:streptogramin lyase